jgi:hypothetical protein
MNENEFFREATLRICGNLEIEVALDAYLSYLRSAIPVDSSLVPANPVPASQVRDLRGVLSLWRDGLRYPTTAIAVFCNCRLDCGLSQNRSRQ